MHVKAVVSRHHVQTAACDISARRVACANPAVQGSPLFRGFRFVDICSHDGTRIAYGKLHHKQHRWKCQANEAINKSLHTYSQ